jgi:hypothetical protein
MEQIEDEVLSPIGLTWDSFRNRGKEELTERVHDRIVEQIQSYELSIEFMVQGFDEAGTPHIFTVQNPGKCEYYDKLGFWAIGSGQHQAVSSLFSTEYNRFGSLEECTARVLSAKLMAESATGVGKETWLIIEFNKPRSVMFVPKPIINTFREQWKKLPRIPLDVIPDIKRSIDGEMARQKAESEKAKQLKQ